MVSERHSNETAFRFVRVRYKRACQARKIEPFRLKESPVPREISNDYTAPKKRAGAHHRNPTRKTGGFDPRNNKQNNQEMERQEGDREFASPIWTHLELSRRGTGRARTDERRSVSGLASCKAPPVQSGHPAWTPLELRRSGRSRPEVKGLVVKGSTPATGNPCERALLPAFGRISVLLFQR